MATKLLPKLNLQGVASGGGWAVGESYAVMAPAEEQQGQAYVVAPSQGVADDTTTAPSESDRKEPEDSDTDSGGTFVDYDKPNHVSPAPSKPMGGLRTNTDPRLPAPKPEPSEPRRESDDDEPLCMSARRKWQPAEIVSTLELELPVRAMEVVKSKVWASVGDGPLSCYTLDGRDLSLQQVASSVTTVRSICYVPEAAGVVDSSQVVGPKPRGGDSLWCGTDDGKIVIFNLFFNTEEFLIPGAHSGPVTHLVRLPNDKVWSAGKDKALRIWDVGTRRSIAKKQLQVAPRDMCVVCSVTQTGVVGHVWTFGPQEQSIRLWSIKDGNTGSKVTVRAAADAAIGQLTASSDSGIHVKFEVMSLKYHIPSRSMWISIFERVVIVSVKIDANSNVTATVTHELPMTAPNVDFVGDNIAILIGRHREESSHDYISAFKLSTDPAVQPQLIHRGSLLAGVSAVGVRHLKDTPFAVVAHTNMRNMRCLSVITTDRAEQVGSWGNPGHDAAVAAVPSLVSRSDSNQSNANALHRIGSGPHASRGATPAQAQAGTRLSKQASLTQATSDDKAPASPQAAEQKRQPTPPQQPSNDPSPSKHEAEPTAVEPVHGNESTASSQVISASTQARTTTRGNAHTSPSGGNRSAHHVNTSFTDSTPIDGNTGRLLQNPSGLPTGQRAHAHTGFPPSSPPGSSARDAVSRVERKVDDVARHVRRLKVSQERSNDFQCLLDEVLKLQSRLDNSNTPLPPLRDGQAEEIDARFQTGEGRTIASVISRLERVISTKLSAETKPSTSVRASPIIAMHADDGSHSTDDDTLGHGQLAAFTRALDAQRRSDRAFYETQLKETQRQLRQQAAKFNAITHGWSRLLAELELATAVAPPPTVLATASSNGISASAVVADLFASDGGLGITDRSSTAAIAFAFNTVSGLLRSHILQGRTIAPNTSTAEVADRHLARYTFKGDVLSSDADDDDFANVSKRTNGRRSSSRRPSTQNGSPMKSLSPAISWSLVAQLGIPHLQSVEAFATGVQDRLRLLQHSAIILSGHTSPLEASGLLLLRAELFAELCGHEAVMEIAEAVTYDWPTLQEGSPEFSAGPRPGTRASNSSQRTSAPVTSQDRAFLKQYSSLVASASLRVDEAGHATRTGLSAVTISSLNLAGLSASPDPREARRAGHNTVLELRRLLVDTSFPVGERSIKGFARWIALWALCFSYYLSHVERTVFQAQSASPPTPEGAEESAGLLPASATAGVDPASSALRTDTADVLRAEALREVKTAASRFDALTSIERRTRFLLAMFDPEDSFTSLRVSRRSADELSPDAEASRQSTRFTELVSVNPFAAYLHGSANGQEVLGFMGALDKGLEESLENAIHTFAEMRLGARGLQEYALSTLGDGMDPIPQQDIEALKTRLAALQALTKHWNAALNSASRSTPTSYR